MSRRAPAQATLEERVYDGLREAILREEYEPGTKLPVGDLSDRFEVSQIPVREALRRLSAAGLVHIVPQRGAVVTQLHVSELRDLYQMRRLLEIPTAAAAAELAGDEDRVLVREAHDQLVGASELDEFLHRHTQLHRLLLGPASSELLSQTLEQLWTMSTRYVRRAVTHYKFDYAGHHHDGLVDAFIDGDMLAVEAHMSDHLQLTPAMARAWAQSDLPA